MNFKNFILFTFSVILFASCTPQKRLHRLLTKHPELTQVDTLIIQDTIITPGVNVDTVFHSSVLKDTITITRNNLQIKFIEIDDTIYLDAEVESDTVILTKEIFVDTIVYTEPIVWYKRFWKEILIILFINILFLFLLKSKH